MHHRIGILGGSFDPIHSAHLAAADIACEKLQLTSVIFVPAGIPYHRESTVASAAQRLHMTEIATEGDDRFAVSSVDVDRVGDTYSRDTIRSLKAAFALSNPHDKADWFFILGADAFQSFGSWREPESIIDECSLVVISRPGIEHPKDQRFPAEFIDVPGWHISSTEIRERLARGESVTGLLPEAVIEFIRDNDLYTH